MPEVEDTLVWDITGAGKINGEDFVLSEMEKGINSGWNVYLVDGRPLLCMFVKLREIIYGGWIYLDDVAEQLSEDVQYKQASFSICCRAAAPPDKDVIAISLPLKKGRRS